MVRKRWGKGNPLYDWQQKHGRHKANKGHIAKRRVVTTMKRRLGRRIRRYRPTFRGKRKMGIPSLAGIMSVAAPQLIANYGTPGYGYNAVAAAQQGDFSTALNYAMINEVMLFTGYDMGASYWNWKAPVLNYGLPIAVKLLRKAVGPIKAGPVRIL